MLPRPMHEPGSDDDDGVKCGAEQGGQDEGARTVRVTSDGSPLTSCCL